MKSLTKSIKGMNDSGVGSFCLFLMENKPGNVFNLIIEKAAKNHC
jgi:hypothetical protein